MLFELPPIQDVLPAKRRTIGKPDVSMLKSQQARNYKILKDFVCTDDAGAIMMTAPAGSGKTYLTSKLIEEYLYLSRTKGVAIAAPTNKAVKVAYRAAEYYSSNLFYQTVHSLLGLKEQVNLTTGEKEFVQDKFNKPVLDKYSLLVVDEISMLSDPLLLGNKRIKGIMNYIEEGRLKVIFTGDRYQIPPVGRPFCALFNKKKREGLDIKALTMDEVVRQDKDNPILEYVTDVRNNLEQGWSFKGEGNRLVDGDKGVYFIDGWDDDQMDDMGQLLHHLFTSENFKHNTDFAKVIAYRNKPVDKYNRIIREMIYDTDDLQRIRVGEKLITNEPIVREDGRTLMIPKNEEIEVMSFENKVETIEGSKWKLPYFLTIVQKRRIDNVIEKERIKILTDDGLIVFNEVLDLLEKRAKSMPTGSYGRIEAWKEFYQFKGIFADVGYNYAITAHKSQGSTYDNAIVLETDIMRVQPNSERNRIIYTACSRPKERLYVL